MPSAAPRPCSYPGCGVLTSGGRCIKHVYQARKEVDARRGNSSERLYDSAWQKARAGYLRKHPRCVCCEKHGSLAPATVVDHIIPHHGDKALFWDSSNWQPLCKPCHDAKTAREDGGFGNRITNQS